jgi:phage tail sheath protein FI
MPEYLAPGVYVEERSFRSKSIEGVSTSTTAFVGATRYGPTEGEPELMTSFSQFERIYGGLDPLVYDSVEVQNYLAHGVRAFFDNGGARLYIARAYTGPATGDGRARAAIPAPAPAIDEADALAASATNQVLSALNAAISEGQRARAAAVTVLRFAAGQVLAALTTTAAPALTYDYGAGPNVETQLNNFIPTLVDPEQSAVQAAFDGVEALIQAADLAYANATGLLSDAAASQTGVSGAYAAGVQAGSPDVVPDGALPADPAVGATAAMAPLNSATAVVDTAVAGLATPAADLDTALTNLSDAASATTIVTETEALTTAAEGVVTAADGSVIPIRNAAEAVTLGRRAALHHAEAQFVARFPGAAGNMTVSITGRLGANVLTTRNSAPAVSQLRDGDLVVIQRGGNAFIYSAGRGGGSWSFENESGGVTALSSLNPAGDSVLPLRLTVQAELPGKFSQPLLWDNLTISALPARSRDSVTQLYGLQISNRLQALETPLVLNAAGLRAARLTGHLIGLADWQAKLASSAADRLISVETFELTGGNDGQRPTAATYAGAENAATGIKSGLISLEDLEEISIVAAPGYSFDYNDYANRLAVIQQINQHLITHCETMRYRVAVLDSPNNQPLSGVRDYRAVLDSKYAALYYPWVRIFDPVGDRELDVPPSGFITGIYARNDNQIGVHKAPANEVVRGAIGLEILINKAQQDVLNPLGINCLRYFEGRGNRVWGARTVSSDPEWKYLNIRRYFVYLEASIDYSTQWAVFEPNGEALWANVRRTVESFLETEWREGRLAGASIAEAYFVRCDRSTMTQNDLDNGRMICLIGVAPLYPAEFVIFRIGQWTADRG